MNVDHAYVHQFTNMYKMCNVSAPMASNTVKIFISEQYKPKLSNNFLKINPWRCHLEIADTTFNSISRCKNSWELWESPAKIWKLQISEVFDS